MALLVLLDDRERRLRPWEYTVGSLGQEKRTPANTGLRQNVAPLAARHQLGGGEEGCERDGPSTGGVIPLAAR
jgi:hypothetical protein